MKKLKLKLEIEIEEISVEEGFYEIHYKYRANGKGWENDMYDSDFENGMSDRVWKKELEDGEAMRLVLEKIADEVEI